MEKKEMRSVKTPKPPYYLATFLNKFTGVDKEEYVETFHKLEEIVGQIPGYLGAETYRDREGYIMTIAYFDDMEALNKWKKDLEHVDAKRKGIQKWYSEYAIRIAKVESDKFFMK